MSTEIQNQVITFYSYKGGTGRTMALANVSCLLAKQSKGKGVLMIDWDLEAPGLHSFFQDKSIKLSSETNNIERVYNEKEGLIDLFYKLNEAISANYTKEQPQTEDEAYAMLKFFDLEKFILKINIEDIESLYLIKAGRFDEKYANRVNEFNWVDFYDRSPSIFRLLAERLTEIYQYVLIDSRTGITDISGVCTTLMPDKLVVVFTPNRQSLTGLKGIIQKATSYRKQSDDLRPLSVFPLPSRIEFAESELRKNWRYGKEEIKGYQPLFEELFKEIYSLPECDLNNYFDQVQIQHVPRYAYGEEIAVLVERSGDRLSLTQSYESFTKSLVNLSGPWEYISETDKVENGEFDVYISYAVIEDVDVVNNIIIQLKKYGISISPRLKEFEIRPGTNLIEYLSKRMIKVRSLVVFVSNFSMEWQQIEVKSFLKAHPDNSLIIPVMLQNGSFRNFPELVARQFLDTRNMSYDEIIERLIWGITGKRPDKAKDETVQDRAKVKLVSTTPAAGGEIAANGSVSMVFSEAMKEVTVAGTAGTVTIGDGKSVTWKPTGILPPGILTLTITGTSSDGGKLASTTVALIVKAPDTTLPDIIGSSCKPANGATGVDPAKVTRIVIAFSEAMRDVKIDRFEPKDAKIDQKMTDDKTLTISFLGGYKLSNEMEVKVTVSGKDLAGNALKTTSYRFVTMKREG